jgi:hypothetical protein
MLSNHNSTIQILQSPKDEQRVEVIIEPQDDGAERVIMRYATWTEGLGWCTQKTIRLDGEQLDDLHRALTVARQRLNRRRAETGRMQAAAQVIQLPTLA